MTKVDHNIIYLRSENSRRGLKELSRLLHKSSQRLKYSLTTLKFPYCIFDYSYFGLLLFRVYFRGGYVNESEKTNLIKELAANPYVTSIYELTGEFDFIVEFASPNPSKFNKELKRLSVQLSTMNDYKIILNLVTYLCPRHYLVRSEILQSENYERVFGGDREKEVLGQSEMKVIKSLLNKPNIRFTHLAKETNLNIKTVKSIYKSLIQNKIVRGFRYEIDIAKLGISKFRVFLRLHHLSPERESQLTKFLLATKEVVQINKTVGDWDVELDIESLDKSRVKYIITKIREEFKDIIERFNIIEFYDYYKRSYLPMHMFE